MTVTSPVGTALVGPGKVAHIHARALTELPTSRFVAVCGRSEERTRAFADQYSARSYTDFAAMLRDPDVELVTICTPHPTHADYAVAAANAGIHVLVEKPMATTLADCDRMISAARERNVKLGVISQRRLYEPVQRVKTAIDAGKIGTPILGTVSVLGWRGPDYYAMDAWRGTWQGEGGGVLVNQAFHQLDLFQWMMGPIREVFGYWDTLNHPSIDVDDTAVAVVRFENGALGSIVASNSQNPGLYARIHVHGSNGASVGVQTDGGSMFVAGETDEIDPPFNDLWTVPAEQDRLAQWQAEDRKRAEHVNVMYRYHYRQIEAYIAAILTNEIPSVSGMEGRKAVELFTAIYRAHEKKRPVRFPVSPDPAA